jgi:hypothetical protein
MFSPAARMCWTTKLSVSVTMPWHSREPCSHKRPFSCPKTSFSPIRVRLNNGFDVAVDSRDGLGRGLGQLFWRDLLVGHQLSQTMRIKRCVLGEIHSSLAYQRENGGGGVYNLTDSQAPATVRVKSSRHHEPSARQTAPMAAIDRYASQRPSSAQLTLTPT